MLNFKTNVFPVYCVFVDESKVAEEEMLKAID
jgi:hypothetical protein